MAGDVIVRRKGVVGKQEKCVGQTIIVERCFGLQVQDRWETKIMQLAADEQQQRYVATRAKLHIPRTQYRYQYIHGAKIIGQNRYRSDEY